MANYAGVSPINSETLTRAEKLTVSLTPVSVAAASAIEQTFTVQGVQMGDFIDITPPGITAGVAPMCARVSGQNQIAVTFVNPTAGALTPLAGVYQIQLNR